MTQLRRKRLLLLATGSFAHKRWYSQYCVLVKEGLVNWTLGHAFLTTLGEDTLKTLLEKE